MPVVYDEAMWKALYSVLSRDGTGDRLTYSRRMAESVASGGMGTWIGRRLDAIQANTGQLNAADVVVVGCGYGWLIELAIDRGVGTAVGVDASPYIHANKATESRADVTIVDATVGVDDVNKALQQAGFPRSYTVVIDEDAASSHTDDELPAFLSGCESLLKGNDLSRIIHLVTPSTGGGQDSAINWKTMAEWKALRPSHTWVNIITGEVAA